MAAGLHRRSTPLKDIRVLLFDVGGVLVQLNGVEVMLDWLGGRLTMEQMWRAWLHSTSVRQFETGKIDAQAFASGVIAEFGLPVESQQFLESFKSWPTGLYPGTLEMLARIPRSYGRALLSNSNDLHWPRVIGEMRLGAAFDRHFVSHLTGRIKPDPDAFADVVESMGYAPADVLFLDDNSINVEAARRFGMRAFRVRGVAETEDLLTHLGIIGPKE
jgi:putative hydrolase of the HAD superfamily